MAGKLPIRQAQGLTAFQQHCRKWHNCQLCDLHKDRKNVVLLRGAIPAKVLFAGEAPGESEDCCDTLFADPRGTVRLGLPFVGPAGKLFDQIVAGAGIPTDSCAFTNIIACIPREEDGTKITTPPKFAVEACAPRLQEIVGIVKPRLIVWVGAEAKKWGPRSVIGLAGPGSLRETTFHGPQTPPITVDVIHPAAILRMHKSGQPLAAKQCVAALSDAWEQIQ